MKTTSQSKWRLFTSVTLIAVAICLGSFSLAGAKQRSQSAARPETHGTRIAKYFSGEQPGAPSAFTFSAPLQLTGHPPSAAFFQQDAEPEIKIDIFGNIYITAIQGVPGGTDLWKSTDNGASFVYLGQPDGAQDHCMPPEPQCSGLGGGDDSIDVSSSGYLYVSSLWLGGTTLSTSFNGGTGGVLPGQAWQVNPTANGDPPVPVNDRQWIVADGPTNVYMIFDQAPANTGIWFTKSTDAGKTFSVPTNLLGVGSISRENNLAIDHYNGNLYFTYMPVGANNQINLMRSTDGGTTWTQIPVYTGPAGTSVGNAFPIIAVDRGGNLHLVFTRSNGTTGRTNAHVFLMSSANQGTTWTLPVQVDSGVENTSTVMPWIVAGSPGVVDITWYGSTMTSPDNLPTNSSQYWKVFFAQTNNALAATPTFTQVQIASGVHDRNICSAGGACTGSGSTSSRMLLEYYTMTLDPDGNAHIAFVDSINNCPTATCLTNAWYVKQTAGTSAYNPPSAPGPATFANALAIGAPGAEPSVAVDSYNCIYLTAPGTPKVWKSVDNGLSFLPNTLPMTGEPTLTGGDEDIITLPRADGMRPDEVYFADLGLSTVHIRKSVAEIGGGNHNPVWMKPANSAAAGDTAVSSDRQWIAGDRGVPTATDQVVYEWDHELASEIMRMSMLVNDGAWVTTGGFGALTAPELIGTIPNTNPGPVFVDKSNDPVWKHRVFALFTASVPTTNAGDPPFGKLLNIWEADAAGPISAAVPPGPFVNNAVFKGVFDSASNPPPAVGPPTGPTYGTNNANIFPAGDIDSAGNIYVAWSMNNSRTNEWSVWVAISHDHGKSYYGPFPVSSGPLSADETAVFPWVAAGDDGRVNIIWYGTSAVGDPNTITGSPAWYLHFAQSLNASSREPVFTVVKPNPGNIIHNGQISTGGLIGSSDRSLLDFMEVAVGPDGLANIVVADNGGQSTRAEFYRQTGGPIVKTNPTFPTCLPGPPVPTAVVSRKVHSFAGTFDIDLLPPALGIECRTGGTNNDFQMVVTFPLTVTITGATVSSGTGSVTTASASGNVVTVNLTGVTNAQRLTVTLNNVTDVNGAGNVPVNMAVLLGDTNEDTAVNSADISQTKSRSGTAVIGSNFRSDVTIDGNLNSADIGLVKSKSGTALP